MIKGCECIFPDTVFFEKGKARLIVRHDKEFCLVGIKNSTKLNNQNIFKDFTTIVRERKKDTLGVFYHKYGPDILKMEKVVGNMSANLLSMFNQSANQVAHDAQKRERQTDTIISGSDVQSMMRAKANNSSKMVSLPQD